MSFFDDRHLGNAVLTELGGQIEHHIRLSGMTQLVVTGLEVPLLDGQLEQLRQHDRRPHANHVLLTQRVVDRYPVRQLPLNHAQLRLQHSV